MKLGDVSTEQFLKFNLIYISDTELPSIMAIHARPRPDYMYNFGSRFIRYWWDDYV